MPMGMLKYLHRTPKYICRGQGTKKFFTNSCTQNFQGRNYDNVSQILKKERFTYFFGVRKFKSDLFMYISGSYLDTIRFGHAEQHYLSRSKQFTLIKVLNYAMES